MTKLIIKNQNELDYMDKNYTGELLIQFGEHSAPSFVENFSQATVIINEKYYAVVVDVQKVKAYDNSHVVTQKNTKIEAYNNAFVEAYSNSKVKAYDNSHVIGNEQATIEAYNNSQISLYSQNEFTAHANATIVDTIFYKGKEIAGIGEQENRLQSLTFQTNTSTDNIFVNRIILI
ncbi:MAG: hypothetical protein R3Y33_00025 [Clostridia bacterium]